MVFGATGQTGSRFIRHALEQGQRVRVLVRDPAKLASDHPALEVHQGSVTDLSNLDELVRGADFIVSMLGDVALQRDHPVNTDFVRQLIPAMRRHGVTRFLYQAGGFSRPPGQRLSPVLWAIKNVLARDHFGQHADNESVMAYLAKDADDIEWMVHRASINPKSSSLRELQRSARSLSIASFDEIAEYNYRTVMDASAVHTFDLSTYPKA